MKCVICKHGDTRDGTTTVTFDRDGMTLVVKDVPARICTNCGEDYVMSGSPMRSLPLQNAWQKAGLR